MIDIRKNLAILAFLLLAASVQSCIGEASAQASDSQTYLNLTNTALAYYSQDLNYSSRVVDEFTRGSISSREAMTATTTLYVLASKTYVDFASISRPSGEAYDTYYNDLTMTFGNYQMYLWLLIKYFETGDRSYATAAAESVNNSYGYFQKALNDRATLATQAAAPASAGSAVSAATNSATSVPVNLTPNAQGYIDVSSLASSYLR